MDNSHIKKITDRKVDSHKGDYGKVFALAGSVGMTGAAYLCSQGALFSGSGLVTLGIPESLNAIMETKLIEVMTLPLPETKEQTISLKAKDKILDFVEKCDAVMMGPGLGQQHDTGLLIKALLHEIKKPVVLDADGLNLLGQDIVLINEREVPTVLTPHPGEMARLIGKSIEAVQKDREAIAKKFAKETGAIVCLKGHRTVVADPSGNVYINDTGNSGMATGGTGDVLTGMITSFIGQGLEPFSAAVSAVYLHGLAGDLAVEEIGPFSLTATDVLAYIPQAFMKAGV